MHVAALERMRYTWLEMGWRGRQGPTHGVSGRMCEWSGFYPDCSGEPPRDCKQGGQDQMEVYKEIILAAAWRMRHRPEMLCVLLTLKVIKSHQENF